MDKKNNNLTDQDSHGSRLAKLETLIEEIHRSLDDLYGRIDVLQKAMNSRMSELSDRTKMFKRIGGSRV